MIMCERCSQLIYESKEELCEGCGEPICEECVEHYGPNCGKHNKHPHPTTKEEHR